MLQLLTLLSVDVLMPCDYVVGTFAAICSLSTGLWRRMSFVALCSITLCMSGRFSFRQLRKHLRSLCCSKYCRKKVHQPSVCTSVFRHGSDGNCYSLLL